ncbi:hypothetical protein EJB05_31552, partial [Eragrostis curvula]
GGDGAGTAVRGVFPRRRSWRIPLRWAAIPSLLLHHRVPARRCTIASQSILALSTRARLSVSFVLHPAVCKLSDSRSGYKLGLHWSPPALMISPACTSSGSREVEDEVTYAALNCLQTMR